MDTPKKLSEFEPDLLVALLATLEAMCPPVGFNTKDLARLNTIEFQLETATLLGRRKVFEEVKQALLVANRPPTNPEPARPAGWDGQTQAPGGW